MNWTSITPPQLHEILSSTSCDPYTRNRDIVSEKEAAVDDSLAQEKIPLTEKSREVRFSCGEISPFDTLELLQKNEITIESKNVSNLNSKAELNHANQRTCTVSNVDTQPFVLEQTNTNTSCIAKCSTILKECSSLSAPVIPIVHRTQPKPVIPHCEDIIHVKQKREYDLLSSSAILIPDTMDEDSNKYSSCFAERYAQYMDYSKNSHENMQSVHILSDYQTHNSGYATDLRAKTRSANSGRVNNDTSTLIITDKHSMTDADAYPDSTSISVATCCPAKNNSKQLIFQSDSGKTSQIATLLPGVLRRVERKPKNTVLESLDLSTKHIVNETSGFVKHVESKGTFSLKNNHYTTADVAAQHKHDMSQKTANANYLTPLICGSNGLEVQSAHSTEASFQQGGISKSSHEDKDANPKHQQVFVCVNPPAVYYQNSRHEIYSQFPYTGQRISMSPMEPSGINPADNIPIPTQILSTEFVTRNNTALKVKPKKVWCSRC